MSTYDYIERSATRHGEYVAYHKGVQRVRRCGDGWETYALGSAAGTFTRLQARTLGALDMLIFNTQIEALEATMETGSGNRPDLTENAMPEWAQPGGSHP